MGNTQDIDHNVTLGAGAAAGAIIAATAVLGAGQYAWSVAIFFPPAIVLSIFLLSRASMMKRRLRITLPVILLSVLTAWIVFQLIGLPAWAARFLAAVPVQWRALAGRPAGGTRISYDPFATRTTAMVFITALSILWLITESRHPSWDFRRAMGILTVTTALICVYAAIASFFGNAIRLPGMPPITMGRFTGVFENPNHFAFFLAVGFPPEMEFLRQWVSAGRRANGRRGARFFVMIGFCVLVVITWLMTLSRGSVIATLISLIAILPLWRFRNRNRETIIAFMFILLSLIIVLASIDIAPLIARFHGNHVAMDQRLAVWRATLPLIGDHPITGVGAMGFTQAFRAYAPQGAPGDWYYAHNYYLTFISEYGIPVALVALAGIGYWIAKVLPTMIKTSSSRRHRMITAIVISMAVAFLHSFIDDPMRVPLNLFLVITLAGLAWAEAVIPRRRHGSAAGSSSHPAYDPAVPAPADSGRTPYASSSARHGIDTDFDASASSIKTIEWRLTRGWSVTLVVAGFIAPVLWGSWQSLRIMRSGIRSARFYSPRDGALLFRKDKAGHLRYAGSAPADYDTLTAAAKRDPYDALSLKLAAKQRVRDIVESDRASAARIKQLWNDTENRDNAQRLTLLRAIRDEKQRHHAQIRDDLDQGYTDLTGVFKIWPADRMTWEMMMTLAARDIQWKLTGGKTLRHDDLNELGCALIALSRCAAGDPYTMKNTIAGMLSIQKLMTDNAEIAGWNRARFRREALRLLTIETTWATRADAVRDQLAAFLNAGFPIDALSEALPKTVIARYGFVRALLKSNRTDDALKIASDLVTDSPEALGQTLYSRLIQTAIRRNNRTLASTILEKGFAVLRGEDRLSFSSNAWKAARHTIHERWMDARLKYIAADINDSILIAYDDIRRGNLGRARKRLLSETDGERNYLVPLLLANISLLCHEWNAARQYAWDTLKLAPDNLRAKRFLNQIEAGQKKYGDTPIPIDRFNWNTADDSFPDNTSRNDKHDADGLTPPTHTPAGVPPAGRQPDSRIKITSPSRTLGDTEKPAPKKRVILKPEGWGP